MPVQTALHLVEQLNSLPLRVVPSAGLLSRALEIGVTESLAVYDAVYIALAEMLEFPLITGDKKQKAAGVATGITLKPVTNFSPSSP
jgi:predicted nucleic acid-binding protein